MPQQRPSMDRDKECPFSAVNNAAGRVWKKLPESDARSVKIQELSNFFSWLLLFFFGLIIIIGFTVSVVLVSRLNLLI